MRAAGALPGQAELGQGGFTLRFLDELPHEVFLAAFHEDLQRVGRNFDSVSILCCLPPSTCVWKNTSDVSLRAMLTDAQPASTKTERASMARRWLIFLVRIPELGGET